jgi:hypothetical protein
MRALLAAGLISLLIEPAYSQKPGLIITDDTRPLDPIEEQKRQAIDRAYKAATDKMPASKSAVDPWGNIRSNAPGPAKTNR